MGKHIENEEERLDLEGYGKINKNPKYFEGVLQLRNPSTEIVDFIASTMDNKGDVFISKQVQHKDGIDLYFSSNKFLKNLGKKLQQKFGGKLKESPRIFTRNRQTSKDVFRLTVLYVAPDIIKGNVVAIDKKVIYVTNIDQMIHGLDLATGKRFSTDYLKKEYEILEKHKTKISKLYPNIEVLHPSTYQSVPVENKIEKKGITAGENVTVVIHNGIWIVQ